MQPEQQLTFAQYRLDLPNAQLWRGKRSIPLTNKAFVVLRYLVEHAGQVVSKAELFAALWPGTAVSDGALTFCIVETRKALGDNAKTPRFIETVHRRGYRFIEKVVRSQYPVVGRKGNEQKAGGKEQGAKIGFEFPIPNIQHPAPVVVGRDTDLAQLHSWFAKALNGERQIVFVTGEAGIGKTTLLETFLFGVWSHEEFRVQEREESQRAKAFPEPGRRSKPQKSQMRITSPAPSPRLLAPRMWVAVGQCLEHSGPGEPYMPILEALGRLCRAAGGEQLVTLLQQHAPTWLVQMPSLLNATELEALQRKTAGATRERMLRELGEALDAITAERPLVLWLEDLHWSDASTVELVALLARRRESARLLVIGTYRPVDVIVQEHPLRAIKQELQLHGLCEELPLGLLSEAQVAEYLTQRFAVGTHGRTPLQPFAKAIHRRTDGNPLFMVTAVDDLVSQGVLISDDVERTPPEDLTSVATRVPDSVQQLITQQIERLSSEDRRMLEVASVDGMEFSVASVAAGLATEAEAVEEQCEGLARHAHFLRTSAPSVWPDGTITARYCFLHALYHEVLYNRIPAGRRQRLHQRIGEQQETAYGTRAREIAAALAVHFEQGRDHRKAVYYLQQAGKNAVQRSAYQETLILLTKGLDLLATLPDTPDRALQEIKLHIALTTPLIATKGYTAPEVERACYRARELCQEMGDTPQLFAVIGQLQSLYVNRGELQTAGELAKQLLQLAQQAGKPHLLLWAHYALGFTLPGQGEWVAARAHLEQCVSYYELQAPRASVYVQDPKATGLALLAWILYSLGYADQALHCIIEALVYARQLAHPFSLSFVLKQGASVYRILGKTETARGLDKEFIDLAHAYGFTYWLAESAMAQGGLLIEDGHHAEGIAQIHQAVEMLQTTGAQSTLPFGWYRVAYAYSTMGQAEKGLHAVSKAFAFARHTGDRQIEMQLHVLQATLTLQANGARDQSTITAAETCFLNAIDFARQQHAKMWQLRSTTGLARLWQRQGKRKEAHKLLSEVYGWFTEGFDTKDLQEARALLAELT